MKRLELFILGCKAERWRYRLWRNSLFTVTLLPDDHEIEPYDINYTTEGVVFYNPTTSAWEPVEDAIADKPLYHNRELASFPAGSVINHPDAIETTYGRMLFNHMVICYAFGDKVPFQHKIKPYDVINLIVRDVVDEDAEVPEGQIVYRPSELQHYIQALFELASLCSYITPTGSEKTLTTHPEMAATRRRLLEENKDRLHDPAVITEIQNKLIALDKEWLKDDNAMDYYIDGKSFTVKRKKMFVMTGIEDAFEEGNNFTLIEKSLEEGWDMNTLPAQFNSIRQGSFDRGHDTALGGEKVTFLQRIFQNARIVPGDCGTKLKSTVIPTKIDYHMFIGMNRVEGSKLIVITEEYAKANIGKPILIRRPALCNAERMHFCEACCGPRWIKDPTKIVSDSCAPGSIIMGAYMSSMHGNELSVAEYDFEVEIG